MVSLMNLSIEFVLIWKKKSAMNFVVIGVTNFVVIGATQTKCSLEFLMN